MEELILKKLLKRGKTDFMTLRYEFPITTEFGSAFANLEKLKLIESEKQNNETIISLTQNGIDANIKGFEKWAEEKVYYEIKDRCFGLTKDTSLIEIKALRNLEDDGFIYEVEKRKYKIVPQRKFISQKNNSSTSENIASKSTTKSENRKKVNWNSIFKSFGWWIMLFLAILAIIEYKYHYVAKVWEGLINSIN